MTSESSVRPALELLSHWDPFHVPFIHRRITTRGEFDQLLTKWTQRSYKLYPILYLAFHASPGTLYIGDGRKTENVVSLDDLEGILDGKCHRRIIHLGGCDSIDLHGNRLNRFLDRTGALAVCGYCGDIDWLCSAVFEIIAFGAMQLNAFTKAGAKAILRKIEDDAGSLHQQLNFRMVVRD